jgi:hypothetical protein
MIKSAVGSPQLAVSGWMGFAENGRLPSADFIA